MTTIENLYFGNINPSEVNVNDDSKIADLTRISIKNENRLLNMLSNIKGNSLKNSKNQIVKCIANVNWNFLLKVSNWVCV